MISGSITKVQDMVVYDELADFRSSCKFIAGIWSAKRLPRPWRYGPFPFRKVTDQVRGGNPRLKDLARWLEIAADMSAGER